MYDIMGPNTDRYTEIDMINIIFLDAFPREIIIDQEYITGLIDDTHLLYDELSEKYGDEINSLQYLAEFEKLLESDS